jgi:hypothetical protein
MALSLTRNVTEEYNENGYYSFDTSGWDYVLINMVFDSGAIAFLSSNDSGAITGVTDGSATSATNFFGASLIDVSTNGPTQVATPGTGMYRAFLVGRFIKLDGDVAAKIILQYHKLS